MKHKAIFGLLGVFLCLLLITISMIVIGILPLRTGYWVMGISVVIYLSAVITLTFRNAKRASESPN